jgi:hypothetical protein
MEPGHDNEAEAVPRQGAALLDNQSRCLLAALLLQRGATDEASDLIRQVLATGDEHVRSYVEEYEL